MNPVKAKELLDDLSTDGKKLHSDKISKLGSEVLRLQQFHGPDIPLTVVNRLNGW